MLLLSSCVVKTAEGIAMCASEFACSRICTEAIVDGFWLIRCQCYGVGGQPKSTAFKFDVCVTVQL